MILQMKKCLNFSKKKKTRLKITLKYFTLNYFLLFNILIDTILNLFLFNQDPRIYTVTVGKKPSQADSYLETISDVKSLMEAFMQISLKKKISNSFSSIDIRSVNNLHSDTTIENSNVSNERQFINEMLENTGLNNQQEFS